MRFTKTEMQAELAKFLDSFGDQLAALYGVPPWATADAVRASPLWLTVNEMYDYGVDGIPTPAHSGPLGSMIGRHIEVERFLHALNTLPMKLFLDGKGITPPRLAILAAQCAAARLVLDGADRRTDYAIDEHGLEGGDHGYLTLAEVALLADMDERSVRNAANPKLPSPLKTEAVGRRSLVRPEEARRWLAARKGFVPTKLATTAHESLPHYDLELPREFLEAVHREATELNVPFEVNLKKRLADAVSRMTSTEEEK